MNKVQHFCFGAFLCLLPIISSAQVFIKVAALPTDATIYGVYAKVCDNVVPSGNTVTGSGQITIKIAANSTVNNLVSQAGLWAQNATIASPTESAAHTYVSFGFINDVPQIIYQPEVELLLFTFKLNGNNTPPVLIENGVDPFDQLPNSVNSNPGNELTVLDFGVNPLGLYTYSGNYLNGEVACAETPQDTTEINPVDTTTTTDTTVVDTTLGGGDTTVIDTTQQGGGDTTVINPPNDTTQQTSGVLDLAGDGNHFMLYPTPAYEWVMVEFLEKDASGGSVRLFTFNGVPIGEMGRAGRGSLKLNVSGLSSGLYILSYEKDGEVLQRSKFLKQ